jgi:hypothetical protein
MVASGVEGERYREKKGDADREPAQPPQAAG